MVIKQIIRTDKFERDIKSIKDGQVKEKIKKQIRKILENPETGKPLRYDLHGELSVYIKPFRLIYAVKKETLFLLRFKHRKEVYQ
tara:strand:+ start:276 stop:530 length:255 start_codon:yes stop_codon:yes gene_type:complete